MVCCFPLADGGLPPFFRSKCYWRLNLENHGLSSAILFNKCAVRKNEQNLSKKKNNEITEIKDKKG